MSREANLRLTQGGLQGSEMDEGEHVDYPMSWTLDNCSAKRWDTVTLSLYACGNDDAAGTIMDEGEEPLLLRSPFISPWKKKKLEKPY